MSRTRFRSRTHYTLGLTVTALLTAALIPAPAGAADVTDYAITVNPRSTGAKIDDSMYGVFFTGGRWNDVNGMRLPSNVVGYLVEYEAVTPEPSSAALSLTLGGLALLRRTRGTRRR